MIPVQDILSRHPGQAAQPREPGSMLPRARWTPDLASLVRGDEGKKERASSVGIDARLRFGMTRQKPCTQDGRKTAYAMHLSLNSRGASVISKNHCSIARVLE